MEKRIGKVISLVGLLTLIGIMLIPLTSADDPNDWTAGGNSFGQNSVLGLTDSYNIEIQTGNFDNAIYIVDSTDRVGIGTTTPGTRLHVKTPNVDNHIRVQRDGYDPEMDLIAGGAWVGIDCINTSSELFSIFNDGTAVFHIRENNNVGIGTTSPQAKLDVRGSAIFNDDSGDYDFRIEGDTDANLFFGDAGNDRIGIGTLTPSYFKLEVAGDIGPSSNNQYNIGKVTNMNTMDTDLSGADASFWGEDADDWSGLAVSGVGDVNGDNYDDFIIGAWGDDDGGSSAGQTYLILGKASDWAMDNDLSDADASFWGEDADDHSGNKVSGVGDVNGDGYDDFIIGAYGDEDGGSSAGQTYLILGKASGWAMNTDLSDADASFWGEDSGDKSGSALSGVGDVNGDGYDDFIIGAWGDDDGGSYAGQTYLILGKASDWSMNTDLSDADASFWGEDADDFSSSEYGVSGVGDVNGDGYDDFIIGAWGDEEGGYEAGQTYLILGKSSGWAMDTDLSDADASFLGEDNGDYSGYAVSGAGDVNGDGYDDFIIGAWGDDDGGSYAGQTYLILGKASGWSMNTDLSSADASFWGEDASDHSGSAVSSVGDVNGDGYDDFIIGAWGDDDGGGVAGQTYLILGKASGWSMNTDLSSADASFWGEDVGDYSSKAVSGAGDVNGDGYDDFIIGAHGDDDGGSYAGQTYLILSNEMQHDSILARHIHAGSSLTAGDFFINKNVIQSGHPERSFYLDAAKISVLGGMDVTGNIGIGTTSPDGKVEILSTSTQLILTHTDATDYATFAVDSDGQLDITTVDGGGTSGGHISLLPDGNVGIGTLTPSTKLEVDGDVAFGTRGTLRIFQGAVTATHSYHIIEAESSTSGVLTDIAGGDVAGQLLIITAASGHTITVTDVVMTGNLQLVSDFSMDDQDTMMLIWDGTTYWHEISSSEN